MARPEYVWRFDINRRKYAPGNSGGPIWRAHWVKHRIVGETRVSYILEHTGAKVSKKPNDHTHVFDENRLAVLVWAHENRHKLADWVKHCTVDQLQQVADIREQAMSEEYDRSHISQLLEDR